MKKKKVNGKKLFYVDCKVYPYHILVYFGKDKTPMLNKLKKTKGMDLDWVKYLEEGEWSYGDFCSSKDGVTALTMKCVPVSITDYGVLSHEVFHAVAYIMNRVGMTLSRDSEEAYAYLTEHIHKEIYRQMPTQ
jgi:hypothetical protein